MVDLVSDEHSLEHALGQAREGDTEGLVVLWTALQPPLLRYLRVVDPDIAEDVASDTWAIVVKDLQSFRGSANSFRSWLFTIATRRGIDAARTRRRRPVVALHEIEVFATSPAADSEAYQAMSLDRALALVQQLPPDQAQVVALRVIAGLDVAAVAQVLGKQPGNVRVLCHRGLRQLSQTISPDCLVV